MIPEQPRIYGERPARQDAGALVRRRINTACQYQRGEEDWRERFILRPIIRPTSSTTTGRPYGTRAWGVWLDDSRPVGIVSTTAAGRMKFLPYGLHGCQIDTDN